MAGTVTLLRYQFRGFWRRVRRGNLLLGCFVVFVSGIYTSNHLRHEALQLPRQVGAIQLWIWILLFLWILPAGHDPALPITIARLRHYPLSRLKLLLFQIGSSFLHPMLHVVLAVTVISCFALQSAPAPWTGTCLLVCGAVIFYGLGVIMANIKGRLPFVGIAAALALVLVALQSSSFLEERVLSLSPALLIAQAAAGLSGRRSFVYLAVVLIVTFLAVWLTFPLATSNAPPSNRKQIPWLPYHALPLAALVNKDVRYLGQLVAPYIAITVTSVSVFLLGRSPVVAAEAIAAIFVATFLICMAIPVNLFGLESASSIDRLTLFPVTARTILAAKDLAFGSLIALQALILFPLVWWRLGFDVVLWSLVTAFAMTVCYLSVGNIASVLYPVKIHLTGLGSGSIAYTNLTIAIGTSSAFLMIGALHQAVHRMLWSGAVVLASIILYLPSFYFAARKFERRREMIRSSLLP